jgi:hypothetical protein
VQPADAILAPAELTEPISLARHLIPTAPKRLRNLIFFLFCFLSLPFGLAGESFLAGGGSGKAESRATGATKTNFVFALPLVLVHYAGSMLTRLTN